MNGITNKLQASILSGLIVLSLYFCQPLMVTGVLQARHPMVNRVEIIMVVSHQVVLVILLKVDTYRGRFVMLYLR